MKKVICLVLGACLALPMAAHATENVNIFANDVPISAEGILINDTTYVPLRAVSEALGAHVAWDGNTRSVSITADEDAKVSQIIRSASESVVAIVGNYSSEYISGTAGDYNELTAHGSGVVIRSGGVILTNAHVVSDIKNLTVVFSDGESYPGYVQYIDKDSDLAVVKVER